jgi:hypothetical protein
LYSLHKLLTQLTLALVLALTVAFEGLMGRFRAASMARESRNCEFAGRIGDLSAVAPKAKAEAYSANSPLAGWIWCIIYKYQHEVEPPRKGPRMVDIRKNGVEDQPEARTATRRWAEFLILQLALLGGAFAAFSAHGISDAWPLVAGGGWQTVLIASATMSIGFGAALLLYDRSGYRHAEQLETDYRSLKARADSLLSASSLKRHEK